MKNRVHLVVSISLLGVIVGPGTEVRAADFISSQNMSYWQMITGARNASLRTDAAYYNPAGTVWLSREGWSIEAGLITMRQESRINVDYGLNSEGGEPNLRDEYNLIAFAPAMPCVNVVYRSDFWAAFFNLGISKGGGSGTFDDGLPGIDRSTRAQLITSLSSLYTMSEAIGVADNPSIVRIKSNGENWIIGGGPLAGLAYRLTESWSIAGAVRYVYQKSHTEADAYTQNVSGYAEYDFLNSHTKIENDADGTCYGLFLGADYRPDDCWLVANTFRYHTTLDMDADEGEDIRETYAPVWSPGISFQATRHTKLLLSGDLYFYNMVDDNTNADQYDDLSYGFDFGAEYTISSRVILGAGIGYAKGGALKDEYQGDMNNTYASVYPKIGIEYKISSSTELGVGLQLGIPLENPDSTHQAVLDPSVSTTAADVSYREKYEADISYAFSVGFTIHL